MNKSRSISILFLELLVYEGSSVYSSGQGCEFQNNCVGSQTFYHCCLGDEVALHIGVVLAFYLAQEDEGASRNVDGGVVAEQADLGSFHEPSQLFFRQIFLNGVHS